jgi:predicted phage terminase large subunit-like protein
VSQNNETPEVLEQLPSAQRRELASRVLARRNLVHFIQRMKPQYEAGWVHRDIGARLEKFSADVRDRKSPRLMILMPPRHGKSEMASVRFPAWHLGHYPTHEVINCGYNMDLPMRFSRQVREIVRDKAYQALFEGTQIDPESQSAEAWNVTMGGGFTAAGVGGGITGKGAHVLIIDDPIKNQEEADSITVRDALWSWYWSTAYTRLAPGGGVLVIQTWWNDDDLAGRLQSQMHSEDGKADKFDVVKYPALAEAYEYEHKTTREIVRSVEPLTEQPGLGEYTLEDFTFLRAPGEALHPERYSIEMMQNYKNNMPPRTWSALYQQNPVPDEGMYFQKDWVKYESVSPQLYNRNVYQAWDFAWGEKNHNDYTVGVTLIQDENNHLHLVDIVRIKADTFAVATAVMNFVLKWGGEKTAPLTLGFEDGAIWRGVKPFFHSLMNEHKVYPPYEELKALTDKMARARALQGRMQQGRVWFPQEAGWTGTVVQELLRFPAGAHDDIVDALAHAVNLCVEKSPKLGRQPPRLQSWKDKLAGLGRGDGSFMSA